MGGSDSGKNLKPEERRTKEVMVRLNSAENADLRLQLNTIKQLSGRTIPAAEYVRKCLRHGGLDTVIDETRDDRRAT